MTRAERLAQELGVEKLTGAARALADEAVLITGRLESLDRILAGSEDEWLGIQQRLGSDVATVTVNAPLAEARQQAVALRAILESLAKLTGKEQVQAPASSVDEVAKRRAERRKSAGLGG